MLRKHHFVLFVIGLVLSTLIGCGGEEDTGATASLSWTAVPDQAKISYTVHYGKQSSGEAGSCKYENAVDTDQPFAMVTGLEFNTLYFFAVSAFNGLRSACSEEVTKLTPSLQIGTQPESSNELSLGR